MEDAIALVSKVFRAFELVELNANPPFQTLCVNYYLAHHDWYEMVQENVLAKNSITADMLKDAINLIRGAVMISFPQGLPKWDLVQQAITGTFSCIVLIFLFLPCEYSA